MTFVFGGTFPVLPGKEERVRGFEKELGPHRQAWDELCHETGFVGVSILLQQTPDGFFATYINEVTDPTKVRLQFGDSAYDTWWLSYFQDVHGIDLGAIPPDQQKPPAETAFVWKA